MYMKKRVILSVVVVTGLIFASYMTFWETNTRVNSSDAVNNFFANYKHDCVVYRSDGSQPKYTNQFTGLTFNYPHGTLVCEKFTNQENESSQEVTVWKESEFYSNAPALPIAIVYFDNPLVINLPQPIVLSSENVTIGDEPVIVKTVKPQGCTDEHCLTYKTMSLTKNGHNIMVELRTNEITIQDFSFD